MQATVLFDSVALCSCLAMIFMLVCSVVMLLNRLNQYSMSPREIVEASHKIDTLEAKLRMKQDSYDELYEGFQSLKQKVDSLKEDNETLSTEIVRLLDSLKNDSEEIKRRGEEVTKLKAANKELEEELIDLEESHEKLVASYTGDLHYLRRSNESLNNRLASQAKELEDTKLMATAMQQSEAATVSINKQQSETIASLSSLLSDVKYTAEVARKATDNMVVAMSKELTDTKMSIKLFKEAVNEESRKKELAVNMSKFWQNKYNQEASRCEQMEARLKSVKELLTPSQEPDTLAKDPSTPVKEPATPVLSPVDPAKGPDQTAVLTVWQDSCKDTVWVYNVS